MAGKRDRAVVSIISGLTPGQAANISREIQMAKQKHAPFSRGTIASRPLDSVGKLLQRGQRFLKG